MSYAEMKQHAYKLFDRMAVSQVLRLSGCCRRCLIPLPVLWQEKLGVRALNLWSGCEPPTLMIKASDDPKSLLEANTDRNSLGDRRKVTGLPRVLDDTKSLEFFRQELS